MRLCAKLQNIFCCLCYFSVNIKRHGSAVIYRKLRVVRWTAIVGIRDEKRRHLKSKQIASTEFIDSSLLDENFGAASLEFVGNQQQFFK